MVAAAAVSVVVLVASVPFASAVWLSPRARPIIARNNGFKASTFAGATSSAVFPPPNASNAAQSLDALFTTSVGFAGPTPSEPFPPSPFLSPPTNALSLTNSVLYVLAGNEAEEIATATAVPKITGAFPLLNPSTLDDNSGNFDVLQRWGNLAPMFSVDSFGLNSASQLIPGGCELNQVHLVHRHGARYPTSGAAPSSLAAKLHNATVTKTGFTATGDLSFLNTWTYKLGAEVLTPFGRQQM